VGGGAADAAGDTWERRAGAVAVTAHDLLNGIACSRGLVETLVRRYDSLTDTERLDLLDRARERIAYTESIVCGLVRLFPFDDA
jgi:hypothetical protein